MKLFCVRYADGPKGDEFPMFESLKLTIERTLPYWNDNIVPQIKAGKKILIAAHGNSLRGIVKHLDDMTNEQVRARKNRHVHTCHYCKFAKMRGWLWLIIQYCFRSWESTCRRGFPSTMSWTRISSQSSLWRWQHCTYKVLEGNKADSFLHFSSWETRRLCGRPLSRWPRRARPNRRT